MAANIYDLDVEGVAKIITDNAAPNPSLQVRNSGTGYGLQAEGLAVTSTASIDVANMTQQTISSGVTTTNQLTLTRTVLNGPTIAPLVFVASTASSCFFDFRGAVISTASINLAANQTAGFVMARIVGTGGEAVGFVPIFKGVA